MPVDYYDEDDLFKTGLGFGGSSVPGFKCIESSDMLLVCDVYGAREVAVPGVTGALVSDSADRRGHLDARFIGAKENAVAILAAEARPDDLVLLMGAGNVWQLGARILEALR